MPVNYEAHKTRARERQSRLTKSGQDIGPIRAVANPDRRAESFKSLQRFCELYFPERFSLAWSPDHIQVLARMQEAICYGGLFALAMPRGSGKTAIAEIAALWAVMTGRHAFVVLVAVSATRAAQLLESIKTELLTNDALDEDWPEVTQAVRALEGRANRSKGQHCEGRPTFIAWRQAEVVLPTIKGSQASGAILRVAGLTSGSIRGQKFVRPSDGKNVRPSLVIPDDPQDDESARSLHQCATRHRLVHGAVLGMAGPGRKITAICLCTVIAKGDLADQLLDREKSPLWTGQKFQMVYRFPDDQAMRLWEEYAVRRRDEVRNGGSGALTTAWYGQHKDIMDRGAVVAWPERHNPDELSALQHAMNLLCQDEAAFWAEFQNTPQEEEEIKGQLDADTVAARCNGVDRAAIPQAATRLTAYVDVQQKLLYWLVAGWADDFTGYVVDYGAYPDQQRDYFTLHDAQRTLARAAPGSGLEGSIHAGLGKLAGLILGRGWRREDGSELRVERCLVDANWGQSTDTVYAWCRSCDYPGVVMPAHGRYVGAASKPWSEYQKKPGERLGLHWLIPVAAGKRLVRHLLIDTNFWKSFVAERLTVAVGDKGALTLFGKAPRIHQMLAQHLCSEYRVKTEGRGRVVDEWRWRPERPDNHLWDCLVGAAAAASLQGVELGMPGQAGAKPKTKAMSGREAYETQRKAFEARRGF